MSNETIQETASELKQETSTAPVSSSFSVTDILSPLEVVDHNHSSVDHNHSTTSYMGPGSPSEASAASANGGATSNHFSSSAYSGKQCLSLQADWDTFGLFETSDTYVLYKYSENSETWSELMGMILFGTLAIYNFIT